MTHLEEMGALYWDMYKDAYGVRPRGIDTSSWTEEDFSKEFQHLSSVIEREEAWRVEKERAAVNSFERRVQGLISLGADDRETALRWIHEADRSNGDNEYLCYLNGLPYGYFNKNA